MNNERSERVAKRPTERTKKEGKKSPVWQSRKGRPWTLLNE
jgi:hypothetical protein